MAQTSTETGQRILREKPQTISVRSEEFENGRAIPREFTGHGDDVSPPLAFENVPEEAQAIAIIVEDPDAPRGVFTHWTVWNLPPTERSIPKAMHVRSVGATEGKNDFGVVGYRGPMPPRGTHRYFFRVLALDAKLDVREGAAPEGLWRALEGRVLAWGETMGTFTKP